MDGGRRADVVRGRRLDPPLKSDQSHAAPSTGSPVPSKAVAQVEPLRPRERRGRLEGQASTPRGPGGPNSGSQQRGPHPPTLIPWEHGHPPEMGVVPGDGLHADRPDHDPRGAESDEHSHRAEAAPEHRGIEDGRLVRGRSVLASVGSERRAEYVQDRARVRRSSRSDRATEHRSGDGTVPSSGPGEGDQSGRSGGLRASPGPRGSLR